MTVPSGTMVFLDDDQAVADVEVGPVEVDAVSPRGCRWTSSRCGSTRAIGPLRRSWWRNWCHDRKYQGKGPQSSGETDWVVTQLFHQGKLETYVITPAPADIGGE